MECVADTLQGHLAGGCGIVDMLTGGLLEERAAEMPEAGADVKHPQQGCRIIDMGAVWLPYRRCVDHEVQQEWQVSGQRGAGCCCEGVGGVSEQRGGQG